MTYATADAFNALFSASELIGLTDRAANTAVNDAVANQAFADADNEIHSYIAGVYDVPIDPAPRLLTRVACDIARYRLYDDAVPEEVAARYRQALSWLRDVQAGRASLVDDAGALIQTASGTESPGAAAGTRKLSMGAAFDAAYDYPQHTFA